MTSPASPRGIFEIREVLSRSPPHLMVSSLVCQQLLEELEANVRAEDRPL